MAAEQPILLAFARYLEPEDAAIARSTTLRATRAATRGRGQGAVRSAVA